MSRKAPPAVISTSDRPATPEANRTPDLSAASARTFWTELLDGVDEAVFAVDRSGIVTAANAIAAATLNAAVGRPLGAHGNLVTAVYGEAASFEIDYHDRRLRGRRMFLDDLTVWYVRDITEQTIRTDALLAERWRSAFLAEASRRLSSSLHRERSARAAATLAVPALADVAVVVLPGARHTVSWHRFAGDIGDDEPETGTLTAGAVSALPALANALDGVALMDDPQLDDELRALLPGAFGAIGSAMAVPLPGHGTPAGVLVLVRGVGRAGFEAVETHLARQFAGRAGAAIAAATLYGEQAHTSDVLQRSLELPALPEVAGMTVGTAFRPARERLRIGGDFYDLFAGSDGTWTFALGDVCGKGVTAAVQTGKARQTLHALRLVEADPVALLRLLNTAVLQADEPQLTTLVLGALTMSRGRVRARLASGGHPQPFVVRTGGSVETVPVKGMAVGMTEEARFGSADVVLETGDTLFLFTDGVTEARNASGEFFGRDRLAAELAGYAGKPAPVIAARIEQVVAEWLGPGQHDDIAALAIQASRESRTQLRAVPST